MYRFARARPFAPLLACALVGLSPLAARAQEEDTLASPRWSVLPAIGSPAEDRERVSQTLGRATAAGFHLRTPSSRLAPLAGPGRLRWQLLAPRAEVTHNTRLPFSLNDGALWAGRGFNAVVSTGARFEYGPLSLTLAPELVYSQNLNTDVFLPPDSTLSIYSSQWYVGEHSADLPQRFGDEPLLSLGAGQSVIEARLGPVRAGASTENQWWGPGARNAILFSSHAEGIPHLFAGTARPVRTPIGAVEARWMVGGLVESLYFDSVSTNDVRAINGLGLTLVPRGEPNLTLGVARVVYSRVDGAAAVPGHALDVLTFWDRPDLEGDTVDAAPVDTTDAAEGDSVVVAPEDSPLLDQEQMLALFARWIFPDHGFEMYAEWARAVLPRSFTDFINQPNHTQAYTLGLQWARPLPAGLLRLQTEMTFLEESPASITRPGRPYYVSPVIVQGYTHRGQSVGTSFGPGGSSQWISGDYLAPTWQAGVFGGRIRWDNDVYYNPGRLTYVAHDVSLFVGLRGGRRLGGSYVATEISRAIRYNYRFQNPENNPWGHGGTDVWNTTLRFTVTPLAGSGR